MQLQGSGRRNEGRLNKRGAPVTCNPFHKKVSNTEKGKQVTTNQGGGVGRRQGTRRNRERTRPKTKLEHSETEPQAPEPHPSYLPPRGETTNRPSLLDTSERQKCEGAGSRGGKAATGKEKRRSKATRAMKTAT